MLIKSLCVLLTFGLLLTSNFSIVAQSQYSGSKNSQRSENISKKQIFNSVNRANELLEKDSFTKVNKNNITDKAMQDADKAQQKKKFAGIGTTTAIIIGGVIVAAIIIVLANKDGEDRRIPTCSQFPCP